MVDYVRRFFSLDEELTVEERNLMSIAYKNAITPHRAAWRLVSSMEHKEKDNARADRTAPLVAYQGAIEKDIIQICEDITSGLELHAIPSALSCESKAFYHKM